MLQHVIRNEACPEALCADTVMRSVHRARSAEDPDYITCS
jgi:hypothetical protein